MKGFLIFFGFLLTWCLVLQCWSNLDRKIAIHDKITYEAMMCMQDPYCTLTEDF